MPIHPTAIIDAQAKIHNTVEIGPYCVVGPHASIGANTSLISHVVVENHTSIGKGNILHPFCRIGGQPQDLKFGGEAGRLVIGNDNEIREGATLNVGTEHGGMKTSLGSNCLLMAYSHIAHDCQIGDKVIIANSVALAGHVVVSDQVILGGLVAIHQFCRIGRYAFLAGGAKVAQDVLPFSIVQGDRAKHVGINVVGLKRAEWDKSKLVAIRNAYRAVFSTTGTRTERLNQLVKSPAAQEHPEILELCQFVRMTSRGICSSRRQGFDE